MDLFGSISPDNILSFYIQKQLRYSFQITPEIRKRLFMVAWGDSNDYRIIVNSIKVSTI